ncbi:hypothetical protein AMS68_002104 [Peltaster fructicola]|uniref:Heterokaryon incompatibility domain-containing protein n=1 Tax=Peltaster fructicola TaxID=286661 RepID=A0A6H0XPA1_9PEZI|nr:hypothetical protein AMS68_002104 [Peltaster fructicola]
MRLLSYVDGKLSISSDKPPKEPYAILSHTWHEDEEEVTYGDITQDRDITTKKGYAKLLWCLSQAAKAGITHVWIDTCCINKGDATELQQALNSMFAWYAESQICYVYLADIPYSFNWPAAFKDSRWFTRGWTLQELVAPKNVRFYTSDFRFIGSSYTLNDLVGEATGIDTTRPLDDVSLADRFSWSLGRTTTRPEDQSYCLLGILDVAMLPLYGENAERAQDKLFEAVEREYGRRTARSLMRRQLLWEIAQEIDVTRSATSVIDAQATEQDSVVDSDELGHRLPFPSHTNVQHRLLWSIEAGDLEVVEAMLTRPDLYFTEASLNEALDVSLALPFATIRTLLDHGAYFGEECRKRALFTLCGRQDEPPRDIVLTLLEDSALACSHRRHNQAPALRRALCQAEHLNTSRGIGASIRVDEGSGVQTLLCCAVFQGHNDLARTLLGRGALEAKGHTAEPVEDLLQKCCLDTNFDKPATLRIVLEHHTCRGSGAHRTLELLRSLRSAGEVVNEEMLQIVEDHLKLD